MKVNRKVISIPLYGTLDTETPVEVLPYKFFTTLTNFYPKYGVTKKRGVLEALGAVITGTFTGLHGVTFQNSPQLFRMFNNSGNSIEKWTGSTWASVKTGLTDSDSLRWSLSKYYYNDNEVVAITNDNDDLAIYDGTTYTALGGISSGTMKPVKAKFVLELDGYLLAFNLVQDDGATRYANRIRWCDVYDLTVWGDGSYQDILGEGSILAVHKFNTEIYVFTEGSITRISPTGDPVSPFAFTFNIVPFGTKWNNTVIEAKNKLLYCSSDYAIRAFDGFKAVVLSDSVKSLFTGTPTVEWAGYDGVESQYLLRVGNDVVSLDLGTPVDVNIETLQFAKETYASVLSFLTTLSDVPYGCQGTSVVQLHATGNQDLGATNVSATLTGGYGAFGDRLRAKIGKIRVYGKELSGTGTTTVTFTLIDPASSVAEAVNLTTDGTDITINRWCKQFQITIENSAAQKVSLSRVDIELLNVKPY